MHILWENMIAMLLLLGITFTLLIINANNQETLAESTAYYMLRNDGTAFMELLKRDLKGVEEVKSYSAQSGSFRFVTHIGDDNTAYNIEYRRKAISTADRTMRNADSTWVQSITLYQIERYVNGELWGGSASAISFFEMQALNEENELLAGGDDLGGCRKIKVHFEMVSPFIDNETVDRLRWETTYVPPLLSNSDLV